MAVVEHITDLAGIQAIAEGDFRQIQAKLAVARTMKQSISLNDAIAEARRKAEAKVQPIDDTLAMLAHVLRGDTTADQMESFFDADISDEE